MVYIISNQYNVAPTGGTGSVLVGARGSIFIDGLLNGMALVNVPGNLAVIQGAVIISAVARYGVARSRTG